MKKYEKLIVITLIFVMLFNIVQVRELSADFDNLTRAGLIAFLIMMNIYNVSVMSRDAIMTLFNDFWLSKTNIEQNEFVNSFRTVWQNSFTSGIMSVAAMPMIHSWIKENFNKGYGNKVIVTGEEYQEINVNDGIQEYEYYYSLVPGIKSYNYYIDGNIINYRMLTVKRSNDEIYIMTNSADSEGSSKLYINDNLIRASGYDFNASNYPNSKIKIKVGMSGERIFFQISILGTQWNNGESKYVLAVGEYEKPITSEENLLYYAGEAVDYPMEKEVEDKYIPLPVPDVGMGIPGLDYDVGGNRVFDGTVDQFLDGALDNADYLDSTIDKLLEGGYATSKPYVNVDAGTITWPATDSITWPDTGVIDYPDVTIPEGVVEGIGETNSILQGIGSFVESIFSAPTVELDFSPLTNVNLKEKFPFCLPFDLATLITGLSSKDKDPPNVDFEFTVFNDSYSIPIDFTIFQDWAVIVNWFVLILFIVGLIMISRKLIGG